MKYRPEIDGLRCFAVIPVVLFHAGATSFTGGFVGVDIFFVISGYLIAKIVISEMQTGRFSYARFYERRVRRILPALCVVVLFSLFAAMLLALPHQVEQAAQSGIFALLGISNFFFWKQSGYFAPASDYQLLLHTWSLGVEEQFYLFLPPILFLVFKLRWNLRVVLLAAAPVLFLVGVWLSFNKPSVAFYLLPARAWELLIGVMLAAGVLPEWKNKTAKGILALAGLVAILASIFLIDKQMPFPGWAALLPCLGTAAVIYAASNDNVTGKFLAFPAFRFIGLMSYSLYLWHWPVFVSLRMYYAEPHLGVAAATFGTCLSIFLAFLTWKYIENPFRSVGFMSLNKVLLWLGGLSLVSAGIMVTALGTAGFPNRLNHQASLFAAAAQDIDPLRQDCRDVKDLDDPRCRFGAPDAPISFVLIGDSHAGAIRPAVEQWANSSGRAGTILARGGCPMILGAKIVPDSDGTQCVDFNNHVRTEILSAPSIDTVIIAGRWEALYSGIAPEVGGSYRKFLVDEQENELSDEVTKRVFERVLKKTSQDFTADGRTVVFIGAVPEVGFDVPTILALAAYNQGVATSKTMTRDNSVAMELDTMFAQIADQSKSVAYVSLWREFCSPDCSLLHNGVPIYYDDDHLTLTAARDFIGPHLTSELNGVVSLQR